MIDRSAPQRNAAHPPFSTFSSAPTPSSSSCAVAQARPRASLLLRQARGKGGGAARAGRRSVGGAEGAGLTCLTCEVHVLLEIRLGEVGGGREKRRVSESVHTSTALATLAFTACTTQQAVTLGGSQREESIF